MTKSGKIITGILSFLPIVLLVFQFIFSFGFFYQLMSQSIESGGANSDEKEFLIQIFLMAVNIGLAVLIGIGMLIYLLVHASKNPNLNDDDRLMWIILLVVIGILVFPVYWYMVIWNDKKIDLAKS